MRKPFLPEPLKVGDKKPLARSCFLIEIEANGRYTTGKPLTRKLVRATRTRSFNLIAARFLLKPGRKYEEAVKTFQPYDKLKEPNLDARKAGQRLIQQGQQSQNQKAFIYVNNRLEGNALETISAMLEEPD